MLNRAGDATGRFSGKTALPSADDERSDARLPDAALVDKAGKGEKGAAEELVHRYYGKIYRLVHRMTDGDADAAEERTQQVFLKIFDHLHRFRGESAFSTWVYRIAVNTCLDARKRHRRWRNLLIPWPRERRRKDDFGKEVDSVDLRSISDPESVLRGRELETAVRTAMDSLTDKQRLVCHLKIFEELRISEIADIMGMAEGTVKSHLFRATRSLRERLKHWIDTE